MKKGSIFSVLIVIVMIALSFTGCFSDNNENDNEKEYGHYTINFDRKYSNENERRAIEIAENINYTPYVNLSRFDGNWANFIDNITIDHYNETFFNAKKNDEEIDINYEYLASSKFFSNIDLIIQSESLLLLNITVNNEDHFNIFHDGNYKLLVTDGIIITLINGSEINIIKNLGEYHLSGDFYFDQSFKDVYVVDMELGYSQARGPSTTNWVNPYQIVFLDKDYNLKMVILGPSHVVLP